MQTRILFGGKERLFKAAQRQLPAARYLLSQSDFSQIDLEPYDAVIPISLSEIAAVRFARDSGADIRAIIPPARAVDLCDDKLQFNLTMIANKFGHCIPQVLDRDAPPPFILKTKIGEFGVGSQLVLTETALAGVSDALSSVSFRQSYVRGRFEYAAHFLVVDGRVAFHTSVEYDMEDVAYVRNDSTRGTKTRDGFVSPFYDTLVQMLHLVGFTDGTCCFDYKVLDGRLMVLELNPRFGGSLAGSLEMYIGAYLNALSREPS